VRRFAVALVLAALVAGAWTLARPYNLTSAPTASNPLPLSASPLPGIPRYAQNYKRFPKLNRKPIPNTPTTAHRSGFKNVYVSKRRVNGRYPYGTIIVKEGVSSGYVNLIAVMRKVRGADSHHNDWRWAEWKRSSRGARFSKVSAPAAVCWGCHQMARTRDYVFTR
jgi:hypothetical protein